jgi:membrane protein DedA with SNARE-associated domain
VPWHFWLLIVALVIYLGWRLVQGFEWLVGNNHAVWAVVAGVALLGLAAGGAAWNWWPQADEPGAD